MGTGKLIGKLIRTRGMTVLKTVLKSVLLIAPALLLLYFVSPLADQRAAWDSVVRRETRLIPPSTRSAGAGFRYPELCLTWLPKGEPRYARSVFYYGPGPSPIFDFDAPCQVRSEVYYWRGRKRAHAGGGGSCSEEEAVALGMAADKLRQRMADPRHSALRISLEKGEHFYDNRAAAQDPRMVRIVHAAAAGHSYKDILLVRALEPDGESWRIQAFDRSNLPAEVRNVLTLARAAEW
ncbi:MAG: hypothetical protein V4671_12775 [Armatimonadota bacterium]